MQVTSSPGFGGVFTETSVTYKPIHPKTSDSKKENSEPKSRPRRKNLSKKRKTASGKVGKSHIYAPIPVKSKKNPLLPGLQNGTPK